MNFNKKIFYNTYKVNELVEKNKKSNINNFNIKYKKINKIIEQKNIIKNKKYTEKCKKLINEICSSIKNKRQAMSYGLFRLIDENGNVALSPNKNFSMNSKLQITDNNGKYLTGYLYNKINENKNVSFPEIIDFSKKFVPKINKSKEIEIYANLNINEKIKEESKFNPLDPSTYTKKHVVKIYDEFGKHINLDVYFLKNSIDSWKIISINKKYGEKHVNNTIFLNRLDNTIVIEGDEIFVHTNSDNNYLSQLMFKSDKITTNKKLPTSFDKLTTDGAPIKYLSHYEIDENGNILGIFSDNTKGKLGYATLVKLPENIKKSIRNGLIKDINPDLINFFKNNEV
ncbi:flagellar basal body FlgE domain-containing protein [Buchnera aphidicola (Astegopteryx bambusae)]|uniref:flagellar basal body FlgE domain-containing protein n=1 Tax=Buchnera aphidicola TaxID=9 RepID=UPI0031B813E5